MIRVESEGLWMYQTNCTAKEIPMTYMDRRRECERLSKITREMDAVQRAIMERYSKALQFSLSYIPSDDSRWDRTIRDALRDADAEVRENGLEALPEYNEAVLRAHQLARAIKAQQFGR
jgi:hypothetical protein